jgi:chromosome segregation ATPase
MAMNKIFYTVIIVSLLVLVSYETYTISNNTLKQQNNNLEMQLAELKGQVAAIEEIKNVYEVAQQNVEQTRTLMIEHGKRRIEVETLLKEERTKRENYQNQLHSTQAQLTSLRQQINIMREQNGQVNNSLE